jgi:hypothetical protein
LSGFSYFCKWWEEWQNALQFPTLQSNSIIYNNNGSGGRSATVSPTDKKAIHAWENKMGCPYCTGH